LFTTIPGITGVFLLIIICLMWVTSIERVRRKSFQLFATVHVVCFPLFIIIMVIHGSDTWLNYGFPLGSITVLPCLIIYVFLWIRKLFLQCKGHIKISELEIDAESEFCYIRLQKPQYYKYLEGQYAFINVPSVSSSRWHPFSICTSSENPYIGFLIKNRGDFTKKLIKTFEDSLKLFNDSPHFQVIDVSVAEVIVLDWGAEVEGLQDKSRSSLNTRA